MVHNAAPAKTTSTTMPGQSAKDATALAVLQLINQLWFRGCCHMCDYYVHWNYAYSICRRGI